jgi:hypothetical protein
MGYSFFRPRHEPDSVILETRMLLGPLFRRLPHLKEDTDEFIGRVLDCLAFEKEAQDQLSLMCAELVDDLMHMPLPKTGPHVRLGRFDPEEERQERIDTVTRHSNEMYKFGEDLLEQLRALRLYRGGYLHYQFVELVGNDMLMHRLMVPKLTTKIPIDYLTDEDLWERSQVHRRGRR